MDSQHGFYEISQFHGFTATGLFLIFATLFLICARTAMVNMQKPNYSNKFIALLVGLMAMVCLLSAQSLFFGNLKMLTACEYIQ